MSEFPIKAPMTPNRQQERLVMEAGDMARAMSRIAHEILERNKGVKDLGLVGIRTGGVHLAHRLVRRIQDIEGVAVPIGELDITLYRDDLSLRKEQPVLRKTSVPFDISGKSSCWSMTCCLLDGRFALPWTDSSIWGVPQKFSWQSWLTGGTGNCRSKRPTLGRTSRLHGTRTFRSCWKKRERMTGSSFSKA